jgi:acyl-CoA synthetase (AMP-forming)/AMP-acid ligase II
MKSRVYVDDKYYDNFDHHLYKTHQFLQSLGLLKGSYIGLFCKTNLNFLILYQACCEFNFIPVMMTIVINQEEAKKLGLTALIIESDESDEKNWQVIKFSSPNIKPDPLCDIRVVTKTSGTTGVPRYIAWHETGIQHQNRATAKRMDYHPRSKSVVTIPLWSSYGLSLVHLWQAKQIELILLSTITPSHVTYVIKTCQATSIDAVPRFYSSWLFYLSHRPSVMHHLSSMQIYGCGGDVLHATLALEWQEKTHLPLLDGYGLSEAGPNVALNGPASYQLGTVGKPLDEIILQLHEDNEIVIQSPSLMYDNWQFIDGYVPDLRRSLRTGDLGEITSEGFLRIIGRKKNILIINGYTIYPEQIESILSHYAGMQSVAVTAVNLNNKTRLVCCFISDQKLFIKNDCLLWCRERLPEQMLPQFFLKMESFPVNPNGKIDRVQLTRWAAHTLGAFQHETAITSKKTEII